jgi:hypothetical protein
MSIFTVSSEQVQFTTAAVDPADTFIGGIRFAPDGKVRASTDAAVVFNGGVPQTGSGQVCVVDATSGLPAGTVFVNAIPVSAGNKVCCSTGAAAAYNNGTPYAANGAICATGLASFPLDGFSTADLEAVYSLRRTRTAYGDGASDFIVQVRESSNNWTADVRLDPAVQRITLSSPVSNLSGGSGGTLGAWVGANSAWITIDYDHSGRGRNGSQATVDRQKRLVNAGVLDTTVAGGSVVGANCNTTAGLYQGTDIASFTVGSSTPEIVTFGYSASATTAANFDLGASSNWFTFGGLDPFFDLWANSRPQFTPALAASFLLNRSIWFSGRRTDATTMEAQFDTSAPASTTRTNTGTTASLAKTMIWGGSTAGRFQGRVAECFVFGRNLTAGERSTLSANQFAYWI